MATCEILSSNGGAASSPAVAALDSRRYAAFGSAANTGTGETALLSKTMPASDLANINDGYEIVATGSFAATANAKQVKITFGATTIADSGSVVLNNGRWRITARVFRNTSTAQVSVSFGMTTLSGLVSFSSTTTPAEILANPIAIVVTGTGGASSDIINDSLDINKINGLT